MGKLCNTYPTLSMSEKTTLTGVLNIDKPPGLTSHDVVAHVRRLLSPTTYNLKPKVKVGHTGTLDPFATGVLLVVIGSATRLIQFSHQWDKEYETTFTLGASTDTDDVTGHKTPPRLPLSGEERTAAPNKEEIKEVLQNFIGTINQVPPAYSAVKLGGERLYKKARRLARRIGGSDGGEPILAQARPVTIHSIELGSYNYPELSLTIRCGTGTYIRSLARDMGLLLGTGAYVSSLRRTRIGLFDNTNSIALDLSAEMADKLSTGIAQHIHNPLNLVSHLPQLILTSHNIEKLRQGMSIPVPDPVDSSPPFAILSSPTELVGIATINPATSLLSPLINL